jgi:hypothetical protein
MGARIWFHLNFHYFKSLSLNHDLFLLNVHQVTLWNPPFTVIMNGIFAIYLWTMFWSVFCLKEWGLDEYFESWYFRYQSIHIQITYTGAYLVIKCSGPPFEYSWSTFDYRHLRLEIYLYMIFYAPLVHLPVSPFSVFVVATFIYYCRSWSYRVSIMQIVTLQLLNIKSFRIPKE